MPARDIVAVGASAGGVQALSKLVSGLPSDFPGSVFVVLHLWPRAESLLPQILSRAGRLPALHPRDGETVERGRIYVAPPDYHLILDPGAIKLDRSVTENRHRPSIDKLFRSAASAYDSRVIGVLLTGSDDDGAAGFRTIRRAGGITIVQDPDESPFPEMPRSAIQHSLVDYKLKLAEIPHCLTTLVETNGAKPRTNDRPAVAATTAKENEHVYTCPDCGGSMVEEEDGDLLRFRCKVGHILSLESMAQAEDQSVEYALWAAVRSLLDSAAVLRRLAEQPGTPESLRRLYSERAEEKERQGGIIRNLVQKQ